MSNLLDFLTELAINPQKQEAFIKTPELVIDAVRLSEADKTALKSKNRTLISALFANEFLPMSCNVTEPNPDPLPDPDPFPDPFPPPDSEPPEESV